MKQLCQTSILFLYLKLFTLHSKPFLQCLQNGGNSIILMYENQEVQTILSPTCRLSVPTGSCTSKKPK